MVLVLAGLVVGAGEARADKTDARKHYDRATAAFGLGKYAEAAGEYEAAFRLRPDPALLYNCAQSYRLAGQRARAVELYRNYLRLYGDAPNAEDARKHLANLELELAAERAVPAPHATVPAPVAGGPSASTPSAVPRAIGAPAPSPRVAPTAATPGPTAWQPPAPAPVPPPAPGAPSPPPAAAASPPALAAPAPAPAPANDVYVDVGASPAAPAPAPADEGDRPLVRRPLFWAAVGAAVVAGVVVALLATGGDKDPRASLGVVVAN